MTVLRRVPTVLAAVLAMAAGSTASATYWNLFNNEGENSVSAEFATYATLSDMLADQNRLGVLVPNTGGVGQNIVGTGSNGTVYWNLFNNEGENSVSAEFATYATLSDMLADQNRLGVFVPNTGGVGQNIVGTGSDIVSSIPEPGTLSLLGLGLAGLAATRRRKQ